MKRPRNARNNYIDLGATLPEKLTNEIDSNTLLKPPKV
jgi:hypothetical protein